MIETSISRNLSFEVTGLVPSEKVDLVPYSDFSVMSFSVIVEGTIPPPEPTATEAWRIVLIVIGALVAGGLVAYIIFLCYKKRKQQ